MEWEDEGAAVLGSKLFAVAGVAGVSGGGSEGPCFVFFFFKNPREGMKKVATEKEAKRKGPARRFGLHEWEQNQGGRAGGGQGEKERGGDGRLGGGRHWHWPG